jgi:hypothetical protein
LAAVPPGSVHVDEHEDIGRAVTYVFVVEPSTLTGFGTDRNPLLADELPRGLIEAHDRTSRIGGLGIEIEHVFHASRELSVDCRDAPHLLLPRFEFHLGKSSTNGLAREARVLREADQLAGK